MLTIPYVYRRGTSGSTTDVGELPGKICNVDQAIWMTARRDTLSGSTATPIAPCLGCVTTWKDQSVNTGANNATLLYSVKAANVGGGTTGYPFYNVDYWTGDTTSNFKPFLSFNNKSSSSVNQPNFLAVPYDPSFSKLTAFTFSTIFRARQISPNPVTDPTGGIGAEVVLFQNGNQTNSSSFQNDGWGIDVSSSNSLRIWGYDSFCSAFLNNIQGNSVIFTVNDWTKWMRLTIRVSGSTMQANIYNIENYQASGNTWWNGVNNGGNNCKSIQYAATPVQDWFIAGQKGPGYPGATGDQTILPGSWDFLEYVLYNNWLPDPCIQTIWDYYKTQYKIGLTTGTPTGYTQVGSTGATGSTTTAPVDLGLNYYWSGMIIPKANINRTGIISELQYYVDNSPTNNVLDNVKIYIGHTTSSTFSTATPSENLSTLATDWLLAYSGSVTFNTSAGWSSIPLQTGFNYNNVNNLLIKFESRDGSQSPTGQPSFKYSAATSTMAYNGSSVAYPTGTGVRGNNRPIIKLGFL